MILRLSTKLGNSEKITAGHVYDERIFLRIESRSQGSIIIEMNEFLASDMIEALQPYGKKRS